VIEKRTVERFDLQLEAFVSLPGSVSQNEAESLVTRDISMCGAFLITDRPLPVGSKVCVDMVLTLEGRTKQGAQQAWITDNEGMAVGFDNQSRILPLSKKS
jgi:hypothetical protein